VHAVTQKREGRAAALPAGVSQALGVVLPAFGAKYLAVERRRLRRPFRPPTFRRCSRQLIERRELPDMR
jgi:hypothetical protein